MNEYRITKYDPRLRDSSGAYSLPEEWTSYSDVGRTVSPRSVLREESWCRFESDAGFVHFGSDDYMYVGVPCPAVEAQAAAVTRDLFVQPFTSPYHPEDEGT